MLSVIAMNAINKATTGSGSTLPGTVASHKDRMNLVSMHQSLAVQAQMTDGSVLVPSDLTQRADTRDNTTADFFSALIAARYAAPSQLISANENSPFVWVDEDYDYLGYDPVNDVFWDPTFVADLATESNVSFAHVPLYGPRLRRQWRFAADHQIPLLGDRGPKDGAQDPTSYTYGRDGRWRGHLVFGDGHVAFVETFTPSGLFYLDGRQQVPDNIFRMEQGLEGMDVILAFTRLMTDDGPELQHD